MEKLNIHLENENLRPQLDWIIDHASETNFSYPPVKKIYQLVLVSILCLITNLKFYLKIGIF
jgi:hypothetical protein